MTEEEILLLFEQGEGPRTVFLSGRSRATRIGENLIALANTHGGQILLGVRGRRKGRVEGLPAPEETKELVMEVSQRCSPRLSLPMPEVLFVENLPVLVVTVPDSLPNVYHWRGRYLHRPHQSNVPLSGSELLSLLLVRGEHKFESIVPEGTSLNDLDLAQVSAYGAHIKDAFEDPLQLLLERGYLVNSPDGPLPTYAALLLFGHNPQAYLPHARIQLAQYPGTTATDEGERQEASGRLMEQVRRAEDFLQAHMRRGRIWQDSERVEVTEYPIEAVREAIVNAVVHRDYGLYSDEIRVSMFENRIEIYSPGRLPGSITEDNIQEERFLRNPRIAQTFANIQLGEGMGYGFDRIIAMMEETHLPPPVFRETRAGFVLTLYGPQEMTLDDIPADPLALARLGLNERQVQALMYVDERGQITSREYQELCPEVSSETLRRDLVDLIGRGLLLKVGERRATYYILR
jgi:ATP-dependent DNA helicase RecG